MPLFGAGPYDLSLGDTVIELGSVQRNILVCVEAIGESLTGTIDMVVTVVQSNGDKWVPMKRGNKTLQATFATANETKQLITDLQSAEKIGLDIQVNGVTGGNLIVSLNT